MESAQSWSVRRLTKLLLLVETRVPSASNPFRKALSSFIDVLFSCVVFDPLDGSSNIDAGVNVGTIFGVYKVVRSSFFFIRQ